MLHEIHRSLHLASALSPVRQIFKIQLKLSYSTGCWWASKTAVCHLVFLHVVSASSQLLFVAFSSRSLCAVYIEH